MARLGKIKGLERSGLNKKIQRKIKAAAAKVVERDVGSKVVARGGRIRRKFLKRFYAESVTVDMLTGRPSGLLGGKGSLNAFFGLTQEEASSHIQELANIIDNTRLVRVAPKGDAFISFKIKGIASKSDIYNPTPMGGTVNGSLSWVKGLEQGISGFQNFLYDPKRFESAGYSTSKEAIQTKTKLRSGIFKRQSYFVKLYNEFLDELTKII